MLRPLYSTQAADDWRADQVRHRQRQPLPGGNKYPEFRVERVVIRDRGAGCQAEVVGEGSRLEAPVMLESERAGVYLAGVIVAGTHTNEIFIENGRFHGRQIAEAIAKIIPTHAS